MKLALILTSWLQLTGCATLGDISQWGRIPSGWNSSPGSFGGSDSDRWPGAPGPESASNESVIPAPDPWGRSPAEVAREQAREREERRTASVQRARGLRDIVRGMEAGDVQASWGTPSRVDTAGDPSLGNQRWIYSEGLSGFGVSSARIIYFENGQVAGWETVRQ